MADIFISYASEDRGRVRPLAEALIERGFNVWWDRSLAAGTLYRAETLFLRGVHPQTPTGEVADLAGVVRKARQLMMANRRAPGADHHG